MSQKKSIFNSAEDLIKTGNLAQAAKTYRSIITETPDNPIAHHNFAILLRKLGQIEEAIEHSQKAYNLVPNNPPIILSLGLSLENGEFYAEAEHYYKECLLIDPEYAAALNNLGHILDKTERPLEAFDILQHAHKLHPNDSNISLNLANVCLSLGKPREAQTLISHPKTASEYNTLGIARYVQRDWKGAKNLFRQALGSEPDFAGAHENLALTLLHLKKYKAGWMEYDWRWRNSANQLTKRVFNKPIWNGQPLGGKTLLLHSEQGFGDTIQFIRYAKFIKKDRGKIFLMCQSELVDLLRNVPGLDEVFVLGSKIPNYDFHAPLLSLAGIIRDLGEGIPTFDSYLKVSGVSEQSSLENKNFKIGVCWEGKPRHMYDPYRNRSCPVNLFKIIIQHPGLEIHNLQLHKQPELDGIGLSLIEPAEKISNFKDTAEIIWGLDLVVSIDTAIAHLTGALGRPGIVMLNYAADWRWGNGNGKAPWYPSIQMFRQETPGDWDAVFHRVAGYIRITYLNT